MIENGFVYLPETAPWLAEYLHEMTTFPKGKHDDQVDSTAQFLDWFKMPMPCRGVFEHTGVNGRTIKAAQATLCPCQGATGDRRVQTLSGRHITSRRTASSSCRPTMPRPDRQRLDQTRRGQAPSALNAGIRCCEPGTQPSFLRSDTDGLNPAPSASLTECFGWPERAGGVWRKTPRFSGPLRCGRVDSASRRALPPLPISKVC